MEGKKPSMRCNFPGEGDDLHDVAIGKLFKSSRFASVISLGARIQLFAHQSSPAFSTEKKSFLVTLSSSLDVSVELFAFQ